MLLIRVIKVFIYVLWNNKIISKNRGWFTLFWRNKILVWFKGKGLYSGENIGLFLM